MATKYLKLFILFIGIQMLACTSCKKIRLGPCSRVSAYSFSVSGEFSPQKEVFNVGDTIYFNSTFPTLLLNLVSNELSDYSNSTGINGTLSTVKMDTILRNGIAGLNNFNVFSIEGEVTGRTNNPNLGVLATYRENSSTYQSKIGIKLLQKGLFFVGMNNLASNGLEEKKCSSAGFEMTVTNTNKNIHLFEYALGYTPDNMLQKSIFCFRVQ